MKLLKWVTAVTAVITVSVFAVAFATPPHVQAADGFSLQVSPSPIVTTVKPGQTSDIELKIRNGGTATEELKITPRDFKVNDTDGKVTINDTAPSDVSKWVTFANPTFTVQPGQWFTQKIKISVPKESGFSYSFALVIDRTNDPKPAEGSRLIKASVAVFSLINVDRPGATRKLDVVSFGASKQIYEYLPAQIKVAFKNTGNSIVQPYGNIFIQHGKNDVTPLATLPVNESKGYILPGSTRNLQTSWQTGFPSIKTNSDGTTSEVWDWSKIADFRIGQYTAKLVGVYNDGQRDIPIEADITFWVFPWKIILAILAVVSLVGFGLWSLLRKIIKSIRRNKHTKISL